MNKNEIRENLRNLSVNIDPENFIYEFLECFGLSKTTITRLKKGDFNVADREGDVFHRRRIFFRPVESAQLYLEIDQLAQEKAVDRFKPRFLFVTDFKTAVATDIRLKTNVEFQLEDLAEQIDFFLPLSGAEIYRVTTDNKADRDAAYHLGELYDILIRDNPEWAETNSHHLNVFLARLLFCFFAEDTGIFPQENMFTEILANHTREDGSDVRDFLGKLFDKLNSKAGKDFPHYLDSFPYVNGGLFREEISCPGFSRKSRKMLIEAGELDWSEINPDIFGSMIQAVADPGERNNLGMHYTSVENILKVIKPLFLDELYEEYESQKRNVRGLKKLIDRISQMKFFDPACGSGNFLIIIYKELRSLEIQIYKQILDLQMEKSRTGEGVQMEAFASRITLDQFYGIEIKDFAHEMAILSLWLAEHQMNQVFEDELQEHGHIRPFLPLQDASQIVCDNAARISWTKVCPRKEGDEIYLVGNPPYLGARVQEAEHKKDMDHVFQAYKKYRDLDYISIWFYKGAKYIQGNSAKLAFVSTNSLSQGQQVALFWEKITARNIEISFAHQSFKWTNNARGNAGVTVVIIGLRNTSSKPKYLYTESIRKKVKNINGYLLDGPNIYVKERRTSISGFIRMNFGNMPNDGGGLILNKDEKAKLLRKNPAAKKYIRKLIGSSEFIRGNVRFCLWMEDEDLEEVSKIDFILDRIKQTKSHRLNSKDKGTNRLAERAHQFRDRNVPNESIIIIPSTSSEKRKYIPIGILGKESIVLNSAMAIYDPPAWLFSVLHSRMHMVWVDAVGGKLETRYRYSAKLCYNTFPFPEINDREKESLRQYVFMILDERARYPEKTIAWMYNPETMPSGLKNVHQELDLAVDRIYRLAPFRSDEERLEYLFKLYEEMIEREASHA